MFIQDGPRTVSKRFETSSIISFAEYDKVSTELKVKFNTGHEYLFKGIPEETAMGLFSATSAGSYFRQYIRKFFTPTKLTEEALETDKSF